MTKRFIPCFMVMVLLFCGCGKTNGTGNIARNDSLTEDSSGIKDLEEDMDSVIEDSFTDDIGKDAEEALEEPVQEKEESKLGDLEEQVNPRKEILIALDPGHQSPSVDMNAKEPLAPGSSNMKAKATGGTTGRFTGVGEYELNLVIAKKVRKKLSHLGYRVIMTRENNETAISNKERAQLANDSHADISLRIHANGSDDSSMSGALVLIASQANPYVGNLYEESYRLGNDILTEYCSSTGMKKLGIQENDTMTGINWSKVPVTILEMGFMTNETDDYNMQDVSFQKKMVQGIVNGIEHYFGMDTEEADNKDKQKTGSKMADLRKQIRYAVDRFGQSNGTVSACVTDLETGETVKLQSKPMIAASLIKLYVAGCIYELQEKKVLSLTEDTELMIQKMLSASDNDATNSLVKMLGKGDALAGMDKVNEYCKEHGYTDSSMGRLMLDFSSDSENYTSVKDTSKFMSDIYYGKVSGSNNIMKYLRQQERREKIPAGVPDSIDTANKTGELDHVENDAAIVFAEHPYVLSVMTEELTDTGYARNWIVDLSKNTYDYLNK